MPWPEVRVCDPNTDKTFFRKLRRGSDEFGHVCELTFCCYHRYRFLKRDRTRCWFIDAMQSARSDDLISGLGF